MKNKTFIVLFLCALLPIFTSSGCKELVPKDIKACVINLKADAEYRMGFAEKLVRNEKGVLDTYTKEQLANMMYSQAEYTYKMNQTVFDYIRGNKPQTTNVLISTTNVSK